MEPKKKRRRGRGFSLSNRSFRPKSLKLKIQRKSVRTTVNERIIRTKIESLEKEYEEAFFYV